ncbi:MAG: trigger factor [Anaerolineae bacterium]|nr:trigger factor [Anaerolineae bacterium]MCX8068296.1 trigger factor [Anaerolineae bacterium]MDW7991625.1 trigger factor [Anaerolineae bacterium]
MSEAPFQVQIEPAGTCTMRVVIQPSEERVQQEMRAIAREISEHRTIPGFRKGKAPYSAILRLFGEEFLRQEAAERLSVQLLADVVKEHNLRMFGPAHLREKELNPMRFVYTVYQPPSVRLGDYRSLRVEFPSAEVSEEDLARALEDLRQKAAVLEPVEGRGSQPGDVLVISVEGRDSEGRLFLQDQSAEVVLNPEDDYPAPGFYRALEGMSPGETRTFRLPMPSEQGGGEAEFRVQLEALYRRILPNIDDDLARTVGNYNSLEELKAALRQRIREQKEEMAHEKYSLQVIDRLVEQAEVEYPPVMLEDHLESLLHEFEENIKARYRLSLQDYLKATGQTLDALRERLQPTADRQIRRSLVLEALAKAEGLDVSEEEIEQTIQSLGESWGDQAEAVRRMYQDSKQRERLGDRILYNKVVSRLVAIARGEPVLEPQGEVRDATL